MKPPVDTVRITQRSRDVLIKLKRKTGIEHWNVLCRWGFCVSLSNRSKPIVASSQESNVEMSWKVFAGTLSEPLLVGFLLRAKQDNVGTDHESLAVYFKSHLERGISQIQNTKDLADLLKHASAYSMPA